MFLVVFGFLFTLGFGFFCLHNTEDVLRLQDRFRITGNREYTDFAILGVKITGILFIIFSTFFIYLFFQILSTT